MGGHVIGLRACQLVVEAASPAEEWEDPAWDHGHGFDFGSVTMSVEVLELVAYGGEDTAFPRADLFGESGSN